MFRTTTHTCCISATISKAKAIRPQVPVKLSQHRLTKRHLESKTADWKLGRYDSVSVQSARPRFICLHDGDLVRNAVRKTAEICYMFLS